MFERFAQAAERAAMSASRREFLGRLGKAAMGAAGVVGTVLLMPGNAQAHPNECKICYYTCASGLKKVIYMIKKCPATDDGCPLTSEGKCSCGF